MTYNEWVFTTYPGITGILLIIVTFLMTITSHSYVRQHYFEIFSYTHLLYIVFIILIIVHGCGFYFNYGYPLSIPFIILPTVMLMY